jgi:hypothetical protein
MFARQLLANEVRVAFMAEKPFPKPILQAIKGCSTPGLTIGNNAAFAKVATNRIERA